MLGTIIIEKKNKARFEALIKANNGKIERVAPLLDDELVYDVMATPEAMVVISQFALDNKIKGRSKRDLVLLVILFFVIIYVVSALWVG